MSSTKICERVLAHGNHPLAMGRGREQRGDRQQGQVQLEGL